MKLFPVLRVGRFGSGWGGATPLAWGRRAGADGDEEVGRIAGMGFGVFSL